MRNTFRYGLASIIVAGTALGATVVACGDDDNGGGSSSGTSGSVPEASTIDSPSGDSATESGTDSGKLPNAKLTIVNAATDLGAGAGFPVPGGNNGVRICFGIGPNATITPLPPQPDRARGGAPIPGIFLGTGGALDSYGLDLEPLAVQPYVMNAKTMAEKGVLRGDAGPGKTCDEILKPGAVSATGAPFVENVDYWKIPSIPADTFKKNKSYVLVLSGCTADAIQAFAGPAGDKCGGSVTFADAGVGNLNVKVFEVDRTTTIPGTEIGATFIHASGAAVPFLATNGVMVIPGLIDGDDAGSFKAIGDGGAVTFGNATALTRLTGINVANAKLIANPLALTTTSSLVETQAVSGLPTAADPAGIYRNGASFVFLAVGDPEQPKTIGDPPRFNSRTFHYLGFPTDPVIATYKP